MSVDKGPGLATILRSLVFNIAFYLVTTVMLIVGIVPFLLMPQRTGVAFAKLWGTVCTFLARVLGGIRLEVRGREHIPQGAAIVAAKHQSAYETFALIPTLAFPTFVIKRELRQIPLFGLYTTAAGMIHVERGGGSAALRALVARAREEIAKQREIIIFPEGTRRAPGAPPDYHFGVSFMYKALGVPVVPVALNSGLFWPRRKFLRYPGTIVIEYLPPIEPGLDTKDFAERLEKAVEEASDRLIAEAAAAPNPPPLSDAARSRIATIGHD
ncbi:1-acyl-sn-glycerol-3-phosphate acyltransferase [Bauldia litoralis]|uniref:1-acyl-sn-glycerol-3-phosphate acyltransferase n=1 Tax=Bauldia litoralis TaxID=665467 RepID=A0A1G6BYZ9_9HYPH|nr:1-acyl-sn-glycerol-3-phosphate acyltransferase [Bauldia litoralis]